MKKLIVFFSAILVNMCGLQAQNDSLIFNNGNFMVGEMKSMNRNVLMVKTDFSDKDFAIEWDGIKEIYSETFFLVSLSDGRRFNGYLKSITNGKIHIITILGGIIEVEPHEIVFLEDIDKGFWSKLYFSIDVGLDLTKAHNFVQLSMRTTLGYKAERWNINGKYNSLYSKQDDIEDIKNIDGGIEYKYFMKNDLYPLASINFLSSTEQKLDLRNTWKAGMGKFIKHTNSVYWGLSLGLTYNIERYSDVTTKRESWEGFLGTELNMFNIGDLSLQTKIFAYPSFTETGRWRSDFYFDAKYEMPFDDDFYIKLGTTVNYDNKPADGASEIDYTLHTGFGWEW